MTSAILRGMAAGVAGTTALNAVTYFDMTLRGRPASDTPQQTVEVMEERLPVSIPGRDDDRDNRVAGLGSVCGIVTGVGIGLAVGLLRRAGVRLPSPVGAVLTGLGAMAATDGSMASLRVSDPRAWSASEWLSDLVPHLAYGAVTWAVLEALDPR
jgi:hypothetical protein